MDELVGKVAVVTGGGSGIGRGIAVTLAAEGMRVALADVREEAAEAVRAEIEGFERPLRDSVRGPDPRTGARYLEELAFEIVNEQSRRDITVLRLSAVLPHSKRSLLGTR